MSAFYIVLSGELKSIVVGPYAESDARREVDSDEGLIFSLLVDDDPEVGAITDVYLSTNPPTTTRDHEVEQITPEA